jgi:hypothetical protein
VIAVTGAFMVFLRRSKQFLASFGVQVTLAMGWLNCTPHLSHIHGNTGVRGAHCAWP